MSLHQAPRQGLKGEVFLAGWHPGELITDLPGMTATTSYGDGDAGVRLLADFLVIWLHHCLPTTLDADAGYAVDDAYRLHRLIAAANQARMKYQHNRYTQDVENVKRSMCRFSSCLSFAPLTPAPACVEFLLPQSIS